MKLLQNTKNPHKISDQKYTGINYTPQYVSVCVLRVANAGTNKRVHWHTQLETRVKRKEELSTKKADKEQYAICR